VARSQTGAARWAAAALLVGLTACGGGGGDGGGGGGTGSGGLGTSYVPGVFQPSESFAARCVTPRTGINPLTGQPYRDSSGSSTDQNNWLRSWTHELYLWYSEVPDLNPAQYQTPAYFDLLKTSATTPSGRPKDQFHFTYSTPEWVALSQRGEEVGYGVQWALIASTPPRRAVVAYVESSPPGATAAAGLTRGAEVLRIDGTDFVNVNTSAGVAVLNAGMFPETAGATHTFEIRELNGTVRTVTLQAATVTTDPVMNVKTIPTSSGLVGYMLFNDHIATAEGRLATAIQTLKNAGVQDLVLDIRYNGGGYLDIASELAYMIAGPAPTAGRAFELLQFNSKHPTRNPVTGQPITPAPFHTRSQGFSPGFPAGQVLPTLDLPRVFVLTGGTTCSASESIINGLRGVDVEVIQIGNTTCGKPYGFYAADNCGTTYFSIQFRGVNAKSFGDYADGFSPSSVPDPTGAQVKGCSVPDDFTHPLGDIGENRLEAALAYRDTGQCVALATDKAGTQALRILSATDAEIPKSPWRMNRILRE